MSLLRRLCRKCHLGIYPKGIRLCAISGGGDDAHSLGKVIQRGHTRYFMNTERLRAIYPTFTDEELREAEENLCRYFACAMQITSEAHAVSLDKSERPDTIEERSLSSSNNLPFEDG